MPVKIIALTALAVVLTLPASADDVFLKNGEKFEGVIAELSETKVRIHLSGGSLELPLSAVARIDEALSPYEEFLRRSEELRATQDSSETAAQWLLLAEWAYRNELRHNAKEATLEAANMAPQLDGLDPMMKRFGYHYDSEVALWVRGRTQRRTAVRQVSHQEQREQALTRIAERIERELRAESRRKETERIARLVALEAQQETERLAAEKAARFRPGLTSFPLAYSFARTIQVVPTGPSVAIPGPAVRAAPQSGTILNVLTRQPGSLIPGVLDLRPR